MRVELNVTVCVSWLPKKLFKLFIYLFIYLFIFHLFLFYFIVFILFIFCSVWRHFWPACAYAWAGMVKSGLLLLTRGRWNAVRCYGIQFVYQC